MNESLLEVVVENAADLAANDKEAFTKIRRAGLGASDSSIILGVNKWTTLEELVMQKRSPEITQEELDIGNKINVFEFTSYSVIIFSPPLLILFDKNVECPLLYQRKLKKMSFYVVN